MPTNTFYSSCVEASGYDLIGDIHGQANELKSLLDKLSYKKINGVWRHTDRKVIFLGDFIDRGKSQREVIDIVKPMVDSGFALSVMGNHEYNAILYYTKDSNGDYLRPHNDKNRKQHKAFLDEFESSPDKYRETIEWFKTLPLWLDLNGLRVVHACWDFEIISKLVSPVLTDSLMQKSALSETWQYHAIETILKGKEIPLPSGASFLDKDKNPRRHIRTRWWDTKAKTYKKAFFGPDDALTHIPDDPIIGDHLIEYKKGDKPVFLGHYWMDGEVRLLAENIACIDYSVAKENGRLVSYRWDGERKLDVKKFVSVKRVGESSEREKNAFELLCDLAEREDWCSKFYCGTCGHTHFRYGLLEIIRGKTPLNDGWVVSRKITKYDTLIGEFPYVFKDEEKVKLLEICLGANLSFECKPFLEIVLLHTKFKAADLNRLRRSGASEIEIIQIKELHDELTKQCKSLEGI